MIRERKQIKTISKRGERFLKNVHGLKKYEDWVSSLDTTLEVSYDANLKLKNYFNRIMSQKLTQDELDIKMLKKFDQLHDKDYLKEESKPKIKPAVSIYNKKSNFEKLLDDEVKVENYVIDEENVDMDFLDLLLAKEIFEQNRKSALIDPEVLEAKKSILKKTNNALFNQKKVKRAEMKKFTHLKKELKSNNDEIEDRVVREKLHMASKSSLKNATIKKAYKSLDEMNHMDNDNVDYGDIKIVSTDGKPVSVDPSEYYSTYKDDSEAYLLRVNELKEQRKVLQKVKISKKFLRAREKLKTEISNAVRKFSYRGFSAVEDVDFDAVQESVSTVAVKTTIPSIVDLNNSVKVINLRDGSEKNISLADCVTQFRLVKETPKVKGKRKRPGKRERKKLKQKLFMQGFKSIQLESDTSQEILDYIMNLKFLDPNIKLESDILRVIPETLTLIYWLYRSRNLLDIGVAFGSFVRHNKEVAHYVSLLAKNSFELFSKIIPKASSERNIRLESLSDSVEWLHHTSADIFNSDIITLIKELFVKLCSYKLFDKDFSYKIKFMFGSEKPTCAIDFIDWCVQFLITFIKKGERIIKGEGVMKVIGEQSPKSSLTSLIAWLELKKNSIYLGSPIENKVSYNLYGIKLDQARDILDVCKVTYITKYSTAEIAKLAIRLQAVDEGYQALVSGLPRITPLGLAFVGLPNRGKSKMIPMVASLLCEYLQLEDVDPNSLIFSKPASSEYNDGYQPRSHLIYHVAELGSATPSQMNANGDPTLNATCGMLDSQHFTLDAAAVELKNKLYFQSMLLVTDSNIPDFNAQFAVSNPAAVLRRFVFNSISVKKEFQDEYGGLDSLKVQRHTSNIMEAYEFFVYKMVALNATTSISKELYNGDIHGYCKWLYNYMSEHFRNEEVLRNSVVDRTGITLDSQLFSCSCNYSAREHNLIKGYRMMVGIIDKEKYILKHGIEHFRDLLDDSRSDCCPWGGTCLVPPILEAKEEKEDNFAGLTINTSQVRYINSLDKKHMFLFRKPSRSNSATFFLESQANYLDATARNKLVTQLNNCNYQIVVESLLGDMFMGIGNYIKALFYVFLIRKIKKHVRRFENNCFQLIFSFVLFNFLLLLGPLGLYTAILFSLSCLLIFRFILEYVANFPEPNISPEHVLRMFHDPTHAKVVLTSFAEKYRIDLEILAGIAVLLTSYKAYKGIKQRILDTKLKNTLDPLEDCKVSREVKTEAFIDPMEGYIQGSRLVEVQKRSTEHKVWNHLHQPIVGKITTLDALQRAVKNNTRLVHIIENKNNTHIFGLFNFYWLINAHAVKDLQTFNIKVSNTQDNSASNYIVEFDNRLRINADLLLIYLPITCNDLTKFLVPEHKGEYDAYRLMPESFNFNKTHLEFVNEELIATSKNTETIIPNYWTYYGDHAMGMCGLPVFGITGRGYFLAGCHFAGHNSENTMFAIPITSKEVNKVRNVIIKEPTIYTQSYESTDEVTYNVPVPKSLTRFEETKEATYRGYDGKPVLFHTKSKLKKTPFYEDVWTLFAKYFDIVRNEETECAKPLLKNDYEKDLYPYNIWFRKVNKKRGCANPKQLQRVVDVMLYRFISRIKMKIRPYTLDEALNGAYWDEFSKKIDLDTGAGYGFPGTKARYINVDENGKYLLKEELLEGYLKYIDNYKDNKLNHPIYTAKLKDEPRSIKKVNMGKTRVYFASTLYCIMAQRQYLTPILNRIQQFAEVFHSFVGIDMHSDAHKLILHLAQGKDPKDCLAWLGDYEQYDTNMAYYLAEYVNKVIIGLALEWGYTADEMLILIGILTELLQPTVSILGDIFIIPGLHLSGTVGTAELNSLKNLMLLILYWLQNYPIYEFFTAIAAGTYGDDLNSSFNKKYPLFNPTGFAEFIETLSMKFTPADKSSRDFKIVPLEEINFLKRDFIPIEDSIFYKSPLSIYSIIKSLTWTSVRGETISEVDRMRSTLMNASIELAYHLNAKRHNDLMQEIVALMSKSYNVLPRSLKYKMFMEVMYDNFPTLAEVGWLPDLYYESGEESCANEKLIVSSDEDDVLIEQKDSKQVELIGKSSTEVILPAKFSKNEILLESMPLSSSTIDEKTCYEEQNLCMSTGGIDSLPIIADDNDGLTIGSNLSMQKFFERPVHVYKGSLALNTAIKLEINVWDLLSKIPSVRAKFKNYAFFKSDLEITINLIGTPQHAGKVMFSYQPFSTYNKPLRKLLEREAVDASLATLVNCYLSQSRYGGCDCIKDVKENITSIIIAPYINYKPQSRLFNESSSALAVGDSYDDLQLGTLFVRSLSPITILGGSGSPVKLEILARFVNYNVSTSTGTNMAITTESGEYETGPLEYISSGLAKVSRSLKVIPMIKPYATASEMIFSGLGMIAAHLGWSRPITIQEARLVKPIPYMNGAITISEDTAYKIALDPKQEITSDTRYANSKYDEMHLNYISSIWSYFTSFTWGTSDDIDSLMFLIGVTPVVGAQVTSSTKVWCQPTAAAFVCAPFNYWRGDVEYKIVVQCNSFVRGKLLIAYDPNVSQRVLINTNFSTNKNYIKVLDLSDAQEIEFTVKWNHDYPWAYVDAPGTFDNNYGSTITSTGLYTNGVLLIKALTPLSSPDNTSVVVHVLMRCSNLSVNNLSSYNLPQHRYAVTESAINDSEAKDDTINTFYFGEKPSSFRALLKRFTFESRITATSVGDYNALTVVRSNLPKVQYVYTPSASPTTKMSLFDYLTYAYLGIVGSCRYRIETITPSTVRASTNQRSFVELSEQSNAESISTNFSDYVHIPTVNGNITLFPSYNGIEYEVPFYTTNRFLFAFNTDRTGSLPSYTMNKLFMKTHKITLLYDSIPDASTIDLFFEFCSGEDFNFIHFMGAPYYSA